MFSCSRNVPRVTFPKFICRIMIHQKMDVVIDDCRDFKMIFTGDLFKLGNGPLKSSDERSKAIFALLFHL